MNERKNKTTRIDIRVTPEVKNYISNAAAFHQCSISDFVIMQCLCQEYVVVDWKNINNVTRLFANISNNINQIARILNYANKNNDIIDEEKTERIAALFNEVKKELEVFNEPMKETAKELLKICSTKKIRDIPLPEDYDKVAVLPPNDSEVKKDGDN